MKTHDRRHNRRGLKAKAVAIAAGALALTLGSTLSASASGTGISGVADATSNSRTAFSSNAEKIWSFGIDGKDSAGNIWEYPPLQNGGFGSKKNAGSGFSSANAMFKNNPGDTKNVVLYARFGGTLKMYDDSTSKTIGGGWNVYNAFVMPGNVGGASNPDLLARDTSGVLWEYLAYSGGTFTTRHKIGGGWNTYSQIAGRGDLTGDGKSDIVARDKSGVLWLYKGTGSTDAPYAARTKIGGGWNTYNKILGLGDSNGDGRADLIARDGAGALWLYPGTGKAASPYLKRVRIGNSGWNAFSLLF
ncbi:FG-GAP repeat domain-containing protein [Streptomyces sp. NBC_01198]|uniref:FG-GAP repeat domain-containing protein n=1 Tax=Streptomyces sp. NBC_01198 TaxID=2903769 RepID=UPI002E12A6EA|nr:VCBS repeat-containing protein [Streptomyces sp. NBC_01198]